MQRRNTKLFPDPTAFCQWIHTSSNPLGHPLALSLNLHPQSGVGASLFLLLLLLLHVVDGNRRPL